MNLIQTVMENKQLMNAIMQAIGSALRGESPIDFMKNLARTNPVFQGYDYDNLEALESTANKVCKEKGEDFNQINAQVTDFAKSYINK